MRPDETTLPAWTLEALLHTDTAVSRQDVVAAYQDAVERFAAEADALNDGIPLSRFMALLRSYERISELGTRLSADAHLRFSSDTQSADAMELLAVTDELSAEMSNRLLFFTLWWKRLDGDAARRLLAGSGQFRYFLENLRRFAPHTLSEAEEKIISLKDVNGINALITLYEAITNGLRFEMEIDGTRRSLSREEISIFVRDPNPELRAGAYREMYDNVFRTQAPVLERIYRHRVRDWQTEHLRLRHHSSPLAVRNMENDIPDDVVDLLLQVCRENRGTFQDYFRWKARTLGVERLQRYDIYAPLSGESPKRYSFRNGMDIVLEAFDGFSPEFADLARRVLDDRRLDAQLRPGKRGGAFCYGVRPGDTPYVLVNFAGTARDLATLAHELGHAVHALLSRDHPLLTFHATLPLAETASVFCELLLTEHLLEREPDVRQDLLCAKIDDAYATVLRQAYFTIFEREAHTLITTDEPVGTLDDLYRRNLEEQFGDAVEIPPEFCREWTSIPHIFHTPFYCYAYSFGQLLVLALFDQFQDEGKRFVPRFRDILAAGGSRSPESILRNAGLEISDRHFWEGGFRTLQRMISSLP